MPNEWIWDKDKRRYIRPNGKVVTPAEQRAMAFSIAEKTADYLEEQAVAFTAARITVAEWAIAMKEAIRGAHSALAQLAWGGSEQMTLSARGSLGAVLRVQYGYMRNFVFGVENGSVEKDAALVNRARMYGDASWSTYEASIGTREQNAGMQEERSFLEPDADHCEECFDEASKDWSPIGSLIPVGERTCLTRCRCSFEYR